MMICKSTRNDNAQLVGLWQCRRNRDSTSLALGDGVRLSASDVTSGRVETVRKFDSRSHKILRDNVKTMLTIRIIMIWMYLLLPLDNER